MVRVIFILIFICVSSIVGNSQTPSKKMMELEGICLTLRDGIGSERSVTQGYKRLDNFQKQNLFTFDSSELKLISGVESVVSIDNHVIFIPQYFKKLLETKDGVFMKGEELLNEWNALHNDTKRQLGSYFRQHNFAMRRNSSVTYEISVEKGPLDILVVAEPNASVSMKIYDATNKVHLNNQDDLVDEKTGKPSRRKTMQFDKPVKLHVSIYNTSLKDASMALFWF